jgi:RNA polymerase sigma-70 factor (ECF subfamily)
MCSILLFNAGYGEGLTNRLCQDAIGLARVLSTLMPDEPEAHGLLALMLLHDARRQSRMDAAGELVTLEDQDRTLWNHAQIVEGTAVLERALRQRRAGPYQIQAAIAACHAAAASVTETDWPQIAGLYAQLERVAPSPIVELNHAVAISMTGGPEAGLRLVDTLAKDGQLNEYYLLHATRADLLRRAGRAAEARGSYQAALDCAPTGAELRFLERRLLSATDGN